jgi:predicted Zn-dependent protease
MMMKRLLAPVGCVALLAACAAQAPAPAPKPPPMATSLADADAAARAGRTEYAYTILKWAAQASPTDKAPWLRIAQMRFEEKNYGEAIVSGLEAIERDPDDTLAYSLVAVSGLRVSSKALNDLTQKNGFSGSVRSEAQDLAALLHNTLKVERIVPVKAPAGAPAPAPRRAQAAAPAPAPAAKACSGPFCGLN